MELGYYNMFFYSSSMRHLLILALLTLVVGSCSNAQTVQDPIENNATNEKRLSLLTEAEAIALAQDFIVENGYTDVPANETKLVFESIELEGDREKVLSQRRNTLNSRAYGISSGRKGGKPGWTVIFQFARKTEKNGRAVTMNLDGSEVRMEHVSFILKMVEKKL